MNIMLLSGSYHSKSVSLEIIKAIKKMVNEHTFSSPRLDELPFYSEDIEGENRPDVVVKFLQTLSLTDGIVFCTPEYNHSIPAVLKNAIDWASRPAFESPLKDKITQAVSPVGGARAQAHMKLILDSTLSRIHRSHEMMICGVHQKFSTNKDISNEDTLRRLKRHMHSFIEFI